MLNYNYLLFFLALITFALSYEQTTECVLCEDLVDIVQAQMKLSNASINVIEKAMNATCHMIVIKPEREECIDIVDEISNIWKWIIDGLYPKDICIKLGLCSNSTNSDGYLF